MPKVKFIERVTVKNGSGVPEGPTYDAGEVVDFTEASAEYWKRRGVAVDADPGAKVGKAATKPARRHDDREEREEPDDLPDLESMTVAQLGQYATAKGVDLGVLTKKADIVAAIRDALKASGS